MAKRIADATGQVFGKVTIVKDKLLNQKALIKCECGIEKIVRRYDVLDGKIKSCGSTECAGKWIDITGQRFDQLVALKFIGLSGNKQTIVWECKCNCGSIIRTGYIGLVTGHKKSCGCIKTERVSKALSLPINIACENQIFNAYKAGAKKRNLKFALTKTEFIDFLQKNCFYCNSTPSNCMTKKRVTGNESYCFNGVDRIDNTIGYTLDNCVACCKICNIAKNNHTIQDFLNWLKCLNKKFVDTSKILEGKL